MSEKDDKDAPPSSERATPAHAEDDERIDASLGAESEDETEDESDSDAMEEETEEETEDEPPARTGPAAPRLALLPRLGVTALAVAIVLGLARVPLPGLASSVQASFANGQRSILLSPIALGVLPFLAGHFLVEVWATISDAWSPLRHAGAAARAPIHRWAVRVALFLLLVQVASLTSYVRDAGIIERDAGLAYAGSLVGGAIVAWLVGAFAGRFGLVNGYALVLVASRADDFARGVVGALRSDSEFVEEGRRTTFIVALVVAVIACAVAQLVPRRRARDAPWVPVPSSSLLAAGSGAIVGLGSSKWGAESRSLFTPLALTAALAVVLTFTLHRPARVAANLRAADPDLAPGATRTRTWSAIVVALVGTLAFFAVVMIADRTAHASLSDTDIAALGEVLPLTVAVLFDLAAAVLLHARFLDATCVWQERRAEVAFALRDALSREAIDAELRGTHVFALFQFFAPPMPIEIFVRAADADRARARIGEIVRRSTARAADAPAVAGRPDRTASKPVFEASRAALLGLVLVAAFIALSPRKRERSGIARDVRFELVCVDDRANPFVADLQLPLGGIVLQELAPAGINPDGTLVQVNVRYVRIVAQGAETAGDLRARAEAWARSVPLPPDHRIVWGLDVDPTTHRPRAETLRSYVLTGPTVLTNDDVEYAQAQHSTGGVREYYVAIALHPTGTQRFADVTEGWVKRRIAILLDGLVDSAPVVQSKIVGGHISITLGSYPDLKQQLRAAEELAQSLDPSH